MYKLKLRCPLILAENTHLLLGYAERDLRQTKND